MVGAGDNPRKRVEWVERLGWHESYVCGKIGERVWAGGMPCGRKRVPLTAPFFGRLVKSKLYTQTEVMKSRQHRGQDLSSEVAEALYGVSLFSGAGIGDLGWRAAGVQFLASCELEHDRAALAALNFPEARHFATDINAVSDEMVEFVGARLRGAGGELFLISCTAPCQGMSKSGQGTLLKNIRQGKRPKLDPRNRLILPALSIITRLRPLWVVFENVVEMRNTVIEDEDGEIRPILDIIQDRLEPVYSGTAYDVEFADHGIGQRRQRLITVYTRDRHAKAAYASGARLIPPCTHSRTPKQGMKRWVSVTEALSAFPPLDGKNEESAQGLVIPFHRVPVLDPKKYEWIRHTPPNSSAFDNQCVNPACGYEGNRIHGTAHNSEGINQSLKDTPLFCEQCGALLPRPFTEEPDGSLRIMSGFTSAYKRMSADLPAPTLTRNLSYPCSDHKIHPTQNRVLSLAEAMTLQTISDYRYEWGPIEVVTKQGGTKLSPVKDTLIRLVIGESIPPRYLELLGRYIQQISLGKIALDNAIVEQRAQLALL